MANPLDTLFIEMAVARGRLERPQADEALSIQDATAADGEGARLLRDIVVEEGWMTAEQVAEVDVEIDEGAAKTGKIEGYRLLSKIGQGGMGAVYKAERTETGETVALKVLPARMARRPEFVDRFLREARAAARMKSDHIVRPVDVGYSGGYYYFAMEFVEGESVDTTLSIDGAMAETKALRIVRQIALALRDASRAGMVHRDIKPGNIIVTEKGVAKLTDFGLARESEDNSLTQSGLTLGTPNYMSPEQARAVKALDVRSDIYSLGVTFYYMVTGSVPFQGETSMLTMLKHLNEPPVAPITRQPELSQGCNDIILRMLAKTRKGRYQNAGDLIEDLDLVLAGKPPRHAAPRRSAAALPTAEVGPVSDDAEQFARELRRQRRLPWLRVGMAVLLVAVVGIVAHALLRSGAGIPRPGDRGGDGDTPAREERIARARLDEAKRFAAGHPAELATIVRKYADVEKDCRATRAYAEANRLRTEANRKLAKAARAACDACQKAALEQAGKDHFGQAVAEYDKFPARLRNDEATRRIEREKRDIEQRAWLRFKDLSDQADVFLRTKQFGAARAVLAPAEHFGIPGVVAEAKKLLARIRDEAVAAGSEEKGRAFEAYQAAAAKVRAYVRSGRFGPALAELERQQKQATDELVRELLTQSRATVIGAKRVWEFVLQGVGALKPGFKITVAKVPRTFVSYDAKKQRMQFRVPGGRVVALSPGWLPPATLRQLANQGKGKEIKAIWFAAFFLARGDYVSAERELQLAKEQKSSTILISRYERQLATLRTSREEIEAENLLAEARELAAAPGGGPEPVARTLWQIVASYPDTRCFAEHRKEIETMLLKAEADSITVDTLFATRPAARPGGASVLRYDFSDPAQAGDWPTVWKGRSTGRWSIRPVDGEMTAGAGMTYFKVPLRGNYRIEIKGKDLRAASIRFGLPEPTASPRAAGLSFHWKRRGDGAESTLEKAGAALGPARKAAHFRVVGALALTVEVRDGAVTARAGDLRSHHVAVQAKPVPIDKPGYVVLDAFNLGARITSVSITCELDREWLEKEFIGPLRKAKLEEARSRMARYRPLLEGNDASGWRVSGDGRWTFAAGYATAPEGRRCLMTTGDLGWSDVAFSAKVRIGTAGGVAWLMTRWTDAADGAGKGYYVELAARTPGAGARIALGKAEGGRRETIQQAGIRAEGAEWYRVYVEVRGRRIRVLFAGREVLSATDDSHAAGRVGLASFLCGAQFTDIKIKVMK